MVVVDSTVWIDYLRFDSEIGRRLDELLERREVVLTGIVLAEILQGASGDKDHEQLQTALDAAVYVDISKAAWIRVGRLARELRKAGQALPLTDLAIASVALEEDHELFTLDTDFQRIPNLRLYDWKDPSNA